MFEFLSSLEVHGMILPWLGKPLVLRLISLRSCQIAVPSDYESKGTESAPVPAHTLVHYRSPLRLVAVAEIGKGNCRSM